MGYLLDHQKLLLPNISMIAAVIPLHEDFGADEFQFWIDTDRKTEIRMTNTGVSQIQSIRFPENDFRQAFGDFHLKGVFTVLNDLTDDGLSDAAILIPERTW